MARTTIQAHNVQKSHQRYDFFCKAGDPLDAAQEDKSCHNSYDDADNQRIDAKHIAEGLSDRIGLHHVAHKAQGQDDSYGKESCQEFSKTAFKGVFNIVDRTSCDSSILHHPGFLGHDRLRVDGSHAEESADPHPEDGAGASGGDGSSRSGNITGSHLGRHRGGQGLERTEAFFGALSVKGKVSEQGFHSRPEFPHLDKPQHKGKKDAGSHQQEQQGVIP